MLRRGWVRKFEGVSLGGGVAIFSSDIWACWDTCLMEGTTDSPLGEFEVALGTQSD